MYSRKNGGFQGCFNGYVLIYISINLHSPFTKLTFIITWLKFTILKLFVTIDLAVMARQFITKQIPTRWCSFAQNGSFFKLFFFNPINLDLKIHFKLVLEWSEHSFIVENAKKSYQGSLILSNFVFWTMKECFDHSKTIFKWNFRSKFMGLKKKFEKRPILSKSIWKIVKLHRQYMYGSQQLTRGATFQAVDNGGDRNCHFLGFARISKFFGIVIVKDRSITIKLL